LEDEDIRQVLRYMLTYLDDRIPEFPVIYETAPRTAAELLNRDIMANLLNKTK